MTWTEDQGKTFAPPVLASQDVLDANYPSFAATPEDRLLLVFQGRERSRRDGWGDTRAELVEVAADGTLSVPMAVPGGEIGARVVRPVVAAGSVGRVFVSWTDPSGANPKVLLSRGRRDAR